MDNRTGGFNRTLTKDVAFTRNQRLNTVWVLTISILLHPLLSYLATPLVESHENGQWSVVCTLQGERTVFVDFDNGQGGDPASCPALKLLQIVGSASMSAPPAIPKPVLDAALLIRPQSVYPYLTPPFSVFSSRAPPFV